jgi:ABC-2 type transport system ATP-binding protein
MKHAGKAVSIDKLTVKFGSFTAVDGISFDVEKGEIFGFLGANGAGKTTAIRVMCGLLAPTSGRAEIAGLGFEDGGAMIKRKVGYMSQKFTLYDDLTVSENLAFKASLRRMSEDTADRRRKELFDFIGFNYPPGTMVRDLPSGVKQQVSLAATLLHDPEIIFLDEPTSGVSPAVRARFWALIKGLAAKGKTVIVTTHYMEEAEQCGRIALMRAGRIIALDSPGGLKQRAYPEPLAEITPISHGDKGFLESLGRDTAVIKFWPYGMKYHAVIKNREALDGFFSRLPRGSVARQIIPSMEDVFIRLVEGSDR